MSNFAPTRARIISLANQKGGVGKTTTAINLAASLAASGKKILLLDLDPQGNASTGLGIAQHQRTHSTAELFDEAEDSAKPLSTAQPNLDIIPASENLLTLQRDLPSRPQAALMLQPALKSLALAGYDYILLDCPPGLNMLTLNGLAGSDGVIVPLQSEFFALEGLSQILQTIEQIHAEINPSLTIEGVLLTMFDPRNNLSNQVLADVQATLGGHVFQTIIPRNVRLSEAPSHGMPAIAYDPRSTGALAYTALAAELLQRNISREAA